MSIRYKTTRALYAEPVTIRPKEGIAADGANALRCVSCGTIFPASFEDGAVTAILTLPAGEYEFEPATTDGETPVTLSGIDKLADGAESFDILIGGDKFASYVFKKSLAKPYLGPIATSFGGSYTRLDFETKEHPHHRSVFFGVGDVSVGDIKNVDFWNEPADCGIQTHAGIAEYAENSVGASFVAKTVWRSHDGEPMIDAACKYKFYAQPASCRYVDLELTYTASYGDVAFGVTKEAGPLGVRMADPLRAERGGYIANSYGAKGESECWGREAEWCVYGGTLDGHEIGVAVFDNSKNERYPTSWHIRDYGLFAANNLYFRGGLTIPSGESLTYKYRLVFFEGSVGDANIADRFITYRG